MATFDKSRLLLLSKGDIPQHWPLFSLCLSYMYLMYVYVYVK